MKPLEKTVTTRVTVDPRITDLVCFVKAMRERYGTNLVAVPDDELIADAESFWDTWHGED
jgi:hypothetical protein